MAEHRMTGALEGLRVLDLSRILAGPWATQILADLGADVVKVESPKGGDDTRIWGPPFLTDGDGHRSDAAYFACCNRNKRSVCIDFATEEGADRVRALARQADILVENFKQGGLARYGLDYETLHALNPRLIYCSVTGFGQTGPYAHRAGYDFLIQGMGGLMSFTGQPDGQPGAEPMKVGVAVSDLFTGMNAVTAILAALQYRHRTGEGQHIDCALLDCQVAMLANQASNWLNGAREPQRLGNNHPNVVPYRVFGAADGHLIIACGNDRQFAKLCTALGRPELASDARFATNEGRIAHRETVDGLISEIVATMTKAETIACLEAAGVPCGPINTVPEVFADEQVRARGLAVAMERPDGAVIHTTAYPVRLSRSPARYRSAPPVLGAHTAEVLRDWAARDGEDEG
jgi:crotonobetainyl-CoA:carnitine CoA-transferase CaiB-like acyl-CoA transferase